ncbi:hypothetical protein R3P38DRAFT_3233167 [Favolaschia claudopus]|uniref:Uncharacterized protein n=1 Tax=Favolaschia claudopus TaxID=2862362 RepID=A0AAV9ZHP5_9AGAR
MSQSLTRCSSIKKCVDMRKRKMKETPLDFTYLTYKEALFYSQLLCWAQHRTYNPPLSSLHLDMIAPNTLAEYLDIETKNLLTRRKGINNDDRFNATYVKSMKAAPAADVSLLSMMKICRLSATLEYHNLALQAIHNGLPTPPATQQSASAADARPEGTGNRTRQYNQNASPARPPNDRRTTCDELFLAARKITWIRHLAMISVT